LRSHSSLKAHFTAIGLFHPLELMLFVLTPFIHQFTIHLILSIHPL
jgi:hypothetical protein